MNKLPYPIRTRLSILLALATVPFTPRAPAYPPAPYHLIYGLVRDQYGTPLMTSQARIMLATPTGVEVSASIAPRLGPARNYELKVPMDSGLTPAPYIPVALTTCAPFKLYVLIGSTTNLPIEMSGNYDLLGLPGQQTRLDLTLGVDANGDGIPDAWENAFLSALGSSLTLGDLNPGMVLTPDGQSLLQQYLLGSYPFNPGESLKLTFVKLDGDSPILQFTTMTGRSYTVLGSSDLKTWTPLSFRIPAENAAGSVCSYYSAPDIRSLQVQPLQPASGPPMRFFKVMLQ
jgi:hypothetical protein